MRSFRAGEKPSVSQYYSLYLPEFNAPIPFAFILYALIQYYLSIDGVVFFLSMFTIKSFPAPLSVRALFNVAPLCSANSDMAPATGMAKPPKCIRYCQHQHHTPPGGIAQEKNQAFSEDTAQNGGMRPQ
jgi:hypothetical protein